MSTHSDKPQPPRPERDSLETIDEQNLSSDRPVQVATGSGSADDPETWEEADGGQTFEADSDLPADVVKTMAAAWVGAIEPGTPARMTIKGNVLVDDAPSSRESQETWDEPATEPVVGAGQATVAESAPAPLAPEPAGSSEAGSSEDSAEATFISDEFAPPARVDDGETTMPEAAAQARQRETDDEQTLQMASGAEESAEKTFLSDEFAPLSPEQPPRSEGQRTEPAPAVDAGMKGAAAESDDSFEATLISDSHPGPEHMETMESGTRGVPARKTAPVIDDLPVDDDGTDLVIKVRAFRQQDGSGPPDAEYQINRVLGEGGMGIVFDAIQTSINRSVAVKMMKKPKAGRKLEQYAASRHKFLAEAVVTGDLDHPNIVPIYDVGRDDKNALFYSMKNVVGTPWLDVIRSRSVHENLEILMRVADAVAFAHARGVVHRDLKPENVMLGEFGEILLMDWGLAFPTAKFRKGESVRRTSSMGGTPAYMAPEMATGPIEKIGPWSDIYLLGAILFEIVTGKPPHRGKNAMKCLMAAAKNQIEPSDKSGELMDIAHKAMATHPKDRYTTVQDFQAAVRDYLSHTESITLSTRAEDDLLRARQTGDYEDFQQAVFGFKESYELWKGNKRAVSGLAAARLAYAECALRREDFDLGIDQLDLSDPQHAALHTRLVAAKAERDARVQRIRTMKRVGVVAGIVFLVTAGSLTVWAMTERRSALDNYAEAQRQEQLAKDSESESRRQEGIAKQNEAEAKRQEALAKQREQEAITARNDAIAAREAEATQRELAERREGEAIAARNDAVAARADEARQRELAEQREREAVVARAAEAIQRRAAEENLVLAERQRRRAEYEAYIAQIGLAAAKIEENAFDSARTILAGIDESQRNWEWGRLMYLCRQQKDEYSVGSRVNAVAITSDGRHFIVGSHDGTARIYDAAKTKGDEAAGGEADQERIVLQLAHADAAEVRAVAFSDDASLAATAGTDNVARVWRIDWAAGAAHELQQLEGHAAAINSVQFSHDGRRLLTGSADRTARVWDVGSGRTVRVLFGHYEPVSAVAFAPRWQTDPDTGALAWKDGRRLWQTDAAGRPLPETSLVTASLDGTAVVWTSRTGRWLPDDPERKPAEQDVQQSTPFRGHGRQPVYAAAFSPRGDRVATGGYDQRVLVWNPQQLLEVRDNFQNVKRDDVPVAPAVRIDRELLGHTNQVSSLAFSTDGRFLVSGARDNTVKVWDVAAGRPVTTFRGHSEVVQSCAVDPEGRWVLSGSHDAFVKKWSVEDYEESRVFDLQGREFAGHGGTAVLGATFSADGQSIVTAGQDRRARQWDIRDAREFRNEFIEGHEYLASSAVFARETNRLLTGAVDDTVRLWDLATGGEIARLNGTGRSAAIALSADEQWILTGGGSRKIPGAGAGDASVWKAQLWRISSVTDPTTGLAREQVVHAFDLEGGRDASGQWLGHQAEVTAVAFSPDASLILTGDQKGHGIAWRWDNREQPPVPLHRLDGHTAKIVAAAFLPQGGQALTASRDNTVAVWDVAAGRELDGRRMVHGGGINGGGTGGSGRGKALISMTLSPDGRRLLTSTEDRTVHLWDVAASRELRSDFDARGGRRTLLDRVSAQVDAKRWPTPAVERVRGMLHELSGRRQQQSGEPEIRDVSAGGEQSLAELETRELAERFAAAFGTDVAGRTITAAELLRPIINSVHISPDGKLGIGANNVDGWVHVWDLGTGREVPTQGGQGLVWAALFAPEGKDIGGRTLYDFLTVGGSGAVLWDAESGRQRISFTPPDAVASAFFSPDGRYVVTASWDNSARIWDTATGKDVLKLEGHAGQVNSAEFSRDGNQVLTASADGTVRLWTIDWQQRTARVAWSFDRHAANVWQAGFAPNGQLVVTASNDGTARVLSAADGRELAVLKHGRAVLCAAFSSDSLRVITGCDDLVARIWSIASDEPVAAPLPGRPVVFDVADLVGQPRVMLELQGHTAPVTAVAFSRDPDSTRALSGSRDNTVKVWDAVPREADNVRGQEIMTLKGHTREVTSARFSPDGRSVLTSSRDGTAIVWLTIPWTGPADGATEVVRGQRSGRPALLRPVNTLAAGSR